MKSRWYARLLKGPFANVKAAPRRRVLTFDILESRQLLAVDVLSYHGDSASTGENLDETTLTPQNVNVNTFGKLFSTPVDGQIYAQPLLKTAQPITIGGVTTVHDTTYVATQNDSVYAIDAHSGQILWHTSFLNAPNVIAVPNADLNNDNNITPEVGITGTPVIDPNTSTLYVVAFTRELDSSNNDHYIYRLHALDLATGNDKFGGPVTIADTIAIPGTDTYSYVSGPQVPGTGDGSVNGMVPFIAFRQLQRPALTLFDGSVFVSFASFAGTGKYHGWVLGFKAPTSASGTMTPTAVWNSTPNGSNGGIWMGGGQIAVDSEGYMYLATGNGVFDTDLDANGFPSLGDYGDSVVKLQVDPTDTPNINGWGLKVVDYFTPFNELQLYQQDTDLGSGGVLVLPDSAGSSTHPHLLIAAGKEGEIFVIDRDNMGKFNPTFDNVVEELPGAINGSTSTPAFFNNTVYYVPAYGDTAKTFSVTDEGLSTTPTSVSTDSFGFPGSTPTISADGLDDGIVWDTDGTSQQLRAYSATSYATELWNSAQAPNGRDALSGPVVKFAVVTVANGLVYVPTGNSLAVYGLLEAPTNAPTDLVASTVDSQSVKLTWTNSSPSQTGVIVQRSTDGVNFSTVVTVAGDVSTYTDAGLQANVTYFYQVISTSSGLNSAPSNDANAKTTPLPGNAPLAPSTLVATPGGDDLDPPYVQLTWHDNDPSHEDGFLVYRSLDNVTYTLLARLPAGQTTYTDPGRTPGTYWYAVASTNLSGDSALTTPASALIPESPARPTDAHATLVTANEIDLAWTDNSNDEDEFQINRRVGSSGTYTIIATLPANTTSYQDLNLLPDTLYNYHIQAINISGRNDYTGDTTTTLDVPGSASFTSSDTTTQGNWPLAYGADGYDVVGDPVNTPAYARLVPVGVQMITWVNPTIDVRGLQIPNATGHIAAAWYGSSFEADVLMTDGQAHEVTLYLLDWDGTNERSERVDVLDATTGNVLDSRVVSRFSGGIYLTYVISGHVQFQFTGLSGPNAVLSGIFFGGVPAAQATYTTIDTTTQGNWASHYGANGYDIAGDTISLAPFASVSVSGTLYAWNAATTDPRALERAADTGNVAGAWYGNTFTANVTLADGQPHAVTLYLLDWDGNNSRSERIDVYDAVTGKLLDTRTVSSFSGGVYLTWNLVGQVQFRFTGLAGANALLSGIFIDAAPAAAAFVSNDSTTQGGAFAKYGAYGYDIIGDSVSLPSYAAVTTNAPAYVWAQATTDPRTLLIASGTNRIAAALFGVQMTVDVNLTDGQWHTVSLYLLDWDGDNARSERIDVIDPATGNVLDSRTVSAFSGGIYLTWNLQGHVQFRFTSLAGNYAVVSGLFIGGPVVNGSYSSTDTTTQGSWSAEYGATGYRLAGDSSSLPTYASITTSAPSYTSAPTTADPRTLLSADQSGRVAAAWYGGTFTVDVATTDGKPHAVTLYLLDWDGSNARSERIDLINPATGAILDTRIVSSFSAGEYLTWNVRGHVQFRVTALQGANAVLSGVFIGGAAVSVAYSATDTTTQGAWTGNYGVSGYVIAGDTTSLPAYAQISTTGSGPNIWNAAPVDPRALLRAGGSGEVAAAWYGNSFTLDVNLTDGQMHSLSLYLLDWDNNERSERIDVVDPATGNILDTRIVSNFAAGEYLTWNIKGHVQFVFTGLQGNAVLSGVFLGSASATFTGTDTTSQGSWSNNYGALGYDVVGAPVSLASFASITTNGSTNIWTASTTDPRALQSPSSSTGIAAALYGATFTVNVGFTDGLAHPVSLYLLDWDGNNGRTEQIDVLDADSGAVLDSRTVTAFSAGEYLTWSVKGHVQFRFTALQGANAVVSGIFLGGDQIAKFVATDTTTQGNWQGHYGTSGYAVAGDTTSLPAYASVSTTGTPYVWNPAPTGPRALQRSGGGSIAATWFGGTFTYDVNLTDGHLHNVSLYLLDWDGNNSRSERIDVIDPATGTILDSRVVSSFSAGEYLTWSVQGHVQFRVTSLAGANAVVSGVFIG